MKLNRDLRKTSSDSNRLQWSTWLSLWVLSFSPLTNKHSNEKLKTADLPDSGNETLKPHRIVWILLCIFWTGNKALKCFLYYKRKWKWKEVFAEVLSGYWVLVDSFESAGVWAVAQWWHQEVWGSRETSQASLWNSAGLFQLWPISQSAFRHLIQKCILAAAITVKCSIGTAEGSSSVSLLI